jgi:hypothetical protein
VSDFRIIASTPTQRLIFYEGRHIYQRADEARGWADDEEGVSDLIFGLLQGYGPESLFSTARALTTTAPPTSADERRVIRAGAFLIGLTPWKTPRGPAVWDGRYGGVEVRRVYVHRVFGEVSDPVLADHVITEALLTWAADRFAGVSP